MRKCNFCLPLDWCAPHFFFTTQKKKRFTRKRHDCFFCTGSVLHFKLILIGNPQIPFIIIAFQWGAFSFKMLKFKQVFRMELDKSNGIAMSLWMQGAARKPSIVVENNIANLLLVFASCFGPPALSSLKHKHLQRLVSQKCRKQFFLSFCCCSTTKCPNDAGIAFNNYLRAQRHEVLSRWPLFFYNLY